MNRIIKNKIIHTSIILFFCLINLRSQNNEVDSLLQVLENAKHDTTRFNAYMGLANYFNSENPDTSIYYHTMAEKMAEKIPDPWGEILKGEALRGRGWDNYLKSRFNESMKLYDASLKIAEKYLMNKDINLKIRAKKLYALNISNMGNIYYANGNIDLALDHFNKALKIEQEINNKLRQAANLGNIAIIYNFKHEYDRALEYHFKSLKICREIGDKKGIAISLGNIGVVYMNKNDLNKALDYYTQSLKINEEIGNKRGQAANLQYLGMIYSSQTNYARALDCYFKALKIAEEINSKESQAGLLISIGLIYFTQLEYDKALNYFFSALKVNKEIGNKHIQSAATLNIANAYYYKGDYNNAYLYYSQSLKLDEEIRNRIGQANNLGNLGNIFKKKGDFSKALEYYFKALKIHEEINNKEGQAINLGNIGSVYLVRHETSLAEKYLKNEEKINRELQIIDHNKNNFLNQYKLYEITGRFKEALHYFKEYIMTRDSIFSQENRKASITKEMQYQYEKEQALKEKEHQKQLAIEKEKQERQKVMTRFIIAGLILVILFSGVVANRLYVTRKQKRIIESQKKIVEEQKQLVEEQKLIVEQKNKDITDSIKYSKRIQDAILPHPQKWKQHLPDSFILYLPKDIVAGDFYWMEVLNNYIYVAAADCTGHGVPGAMVSVVCSSALTKAVLEENIVNTDEILNRVREIVIEKLTGEENIRDGMDICLIRLTKGTNSVQYSGANRPLYIVSPVAENVTRDSAKEGIEATGMQLIELKPDKQPIGRYEEARPFAKQEINLQKNSTLYLTTDGYADQFGGEKGKKIGTKAFKELLKENALLEDPEKQQEHLLSYYRQWKANEEQMDDVTVLGIKLN